MTMMQDVSRPVAATPVTPVGVRGTRPTDDRTARLTAWAGWSMAGIALLHVLFWSAWTWPDWSAWGAGGLWGAEPATAWEYRLHHGYWALIGSFAVPLLLLGLMTVHQARLGVPIPRYVGWVVLAWVAIASALMEPNGFPLGFIPATLLILANRQARPAGAMG